MDVVLRRIRLALVWGAWGGLVLTPHFAAAAEGPQPWHGLHFTNAVTRWDEALPLGNGILGALVWGDGQPLRISLDRTDLWDLRPVPEFHSADYTFARMREWHQAGRHADLVRLYEDPYNRPAPTKIPAGRIELDFGGAMGIFESSTLDLASATAQVDMRGVGVEVLVHGVEPIGVIRVRRGDGGPGIRSEGPVGVRAQLLAPPFGGKVENAAQGGIGAGDLAQLGYPPPRMGGTAEEERTWFVQDGWGGFRFAVVLGWRESGSEWLGVWSIASSLEAGDPLGTARRRVEEALKRGFARLDRSHRGWWREYFSQSSVRVPNPVLERQWYLEQYKFGSASRFGAPPITLQGPWTADDGQLPPWKGDYHHDLNTQLCYWPCYAGNHLREGLNYVEWLWATRSNCVAWTRRFFGLPGLNVPMTTDLNNEQIGGWRQYTHSATTAAWLAHHFYLHWQYSRDRGFLRDRAYPYLRDASVFIEAVSDTRDADGRRTLPLSASPEIEDNRPTAWFASLTNYDLALMRWLLGATAELADELGLFDEARHWRGVLGEMPGFSQGTDGKLLVARETPLPYSHRHFSHLMAIHPLGLVDAGADAASRQAVEASLAELDRLGPGLWCGYSYAWLGSLAAWAGDGAKATRALEIFSTAFTLRNSFHCNGDQSGKGYSKMTYRPFTLEGNFAMAAALQEMLLQSQRGRIEVFPAVPRDWADASFTTLRARGAFLVSAERRGGTVRRVEIVSEAGGQCRVLSPFTGRVEEYSTRPGQRIVLRPGAP